MADISVKKIGDNEFSVTIVEGVSTTIHTVTSMESDGERYGVNVSREHLIKLSFEFLLERESKESILRNFALPIIEHYFPEYPREIRKRIA